MTEPDKDVEGAAEPAAEGRQVLEYSAPPARPSRRLDLALWLMPLWCTLIVLSAYWPVRRGDDPYWYAAIGIPFLAFLSCVWRRRWACACYCLGVCLAVLAIGLTLPSFWPYLL